MTNQPVPKITEITAKGSTAVAKPPSRKFNFTKKAIDALPAPDNNQRLYFHDAMTRGLTLAVSPAGKKTFVLYRKVNRRPERITIGPFPDLSIEQARNRAAELNGQIARGDNPAADRRNVRDEMTMEKLAQDYIELRAKPHEFRTWRKDERMVELYLDKWKYRKISEITKADVAALHSRIGSDCGQIAANRTIQLLRRIFNWAIDDRGWEGVNPAHKVKCFREHSRKRFLQPEEFPLFVEALKHEPKIWRDFFFLALWTGARRSNLLSMEWSEVNFASRTWTIPGSKAKSGEQMEVVLELPAMDILENRKASSTSNWVFPSKGASGHLMEPKPALRRICARAGIENFRVHDLRRTHGSYQAITGTSLHIIGQSLGHRSIASTKPYAQLNLDSVRESVQKGIAAMMAMMTVAEAPKAKLLRARNG